MRNLGLYCLLFGALVIIFPELLSYLIGAFFLSTGGYLLALSRLSGGGATKPRSTFEGFFRK